MDRQPKETTMKTLFRTMLLQSLALVFSASLAFAEDRGRYEQPELDQMLAPVALYPDSLLSQILMAATYPFEVVQAARWSRSHPHLKGQDAVRAVEDRDWDPSVKSLVAFPEIIAMMDQKLDWTERLGDAFLAQQAQVMDTVQALRHRAEIAGNLHSDDRMRVTRQDEIIVIEPVNPRIVYVPYYNPTVVYGPWWWPGYPPVYWAPWPGYYHAGPAFVSGFYWGSGITISTGFFFGAFDWHHRHVKVVHVHHYHSPYVARRSTLVHDRPGVWRHDPGHRRGAPYRHATVRQVSPDRNTAQRLEFRSSGIRERDTSVRREDTRRVETRSLTETQPAPRTDVRSEHRVNEIPRTTSPQRQTQTRETLEPRRAPSENPAAPSNDRHSESATDSSRQQARSERRMNEVPLTTSPQRQARETVEPRRVSSESPVARSSDRRSESATDSGRQQARSFAPRPQASAPAVQQVRPAEAARPQPQVQRFNERVQRQGTERASPAARQAVPAANAHPRAQSGPRHGGEGESRRSAGRSQDRAR
jgi:hypothetical protein